MSRYYLSIRSLSGRNYPTRVLRRPDVTLHVVDPRASKLELLSHAVPLLEPWEHEVGRRAYGQPPPGLPLSDDLMCGAVLPYVPPSIRIPDEPAIQNPDLTTESGRQAFLDAMEWERLELAMTRVGA